MYLRAQIAEIDGDYSLTTAVAQGSDFWRSHILRVSTGASPPLLGRCCANNPNEECRPIKPGPLVETSTGSRAMSCSQFTMRKTQQRSSPSCENRDKARDCGRNPPISNDCRRCGCSASTSFEFDGSELIRTLKIGDLEAKSAVTVERPSGDNLGDWWLQYLKGCSPRSLSPVSRELRFAELFCGSGGLPSAPLRPAPNSEYNLVLLRQLITTPKPSGFTPPTTTPTSPPPTRCRCLSTTE